MGELYGVKTQKPDFYEVGFPKAGTTHILTNGVEGRVALQQSGLAVIADQQSVPLRLQVGAGNNRLAPDEAVVNARGDVFDSASFEHDAAVYFGIFDDDNRGRCW